MKQKPLQFIPFLREHKLFFLCLAVVIGCAALCLPFAAAYTQPLPEQTDLSVQDGNLNGWDIYILEDGARRPLVCESGGYFSGLAYPGQTFYASRTMDETYNSAVLQIDGAFAVSIFLDDQLLYTDEIEAGTSLNALHFSGIFTGSAIPMRLTLPPDSAGKTLTIAQGQPVSEKPEADGSVFFGPVHLYSSAGLESVYAAQATQTAYPAMLLAVTGSILAVLFLLQTFRKKADWGMLFLSLFSFVWMIDVLLRSQLSSYYYGSAIADLEQYFYFGCFIFLSLFLLSRMDRCRRLFLPFVLLQAVSIAVSAAATNLMEYSDLSLFLAELPQLAVFLSVLAGLGFSIAEACLKVWFFRLFTRLLLAAACVFVVFYAASAVSGTPFFTEFNQNIVSAFSTGLFYYPLVILRYLLIASCAVAASAEFIRSVAQRNTDLRLMEQKSALVRESYDQLNRYTHQTMTLRHDLKKHLSVVDFYLQEGANQKAHEYLQEINASMDRAAHISNTGNDLIDLILNSRLSEAEQNGIHTKVSCASVPKALPFSDTDLSSLLMNSLDNAIAAARRASTAQPFIQIDLHLKNGFLYYSCKNSADRPAVPRERPAGAKHVHGYGLPIMEQIVDKNRGIMNMECTQDTFRLNIALPVLDAQRER